MPRSAAGLALDVDGGLPVGERGRGGDVAQEVAPVGCRGHGHVGVEPRTGAEHVVSPPVDRGRRRHVFKFEQG